MPVGPVLTAACLSSRSRALSSCLSATCAAECWRPSACQGTGCGLLHEESCFCLYRLCRACGGACKQGGGGRRVTSPGHAMLLHVRRRPAPLLCRALSGRMASWVAALTHIGLARASSGWASRLPSWAVPSNCRLPRRKAGAEEKLPAWWVWCRCTACPDSCTTQALTRRNPAHRNPAIHTNTTLVHALVPCFGQPASPRKPLQEAHGSDETAGAARRWLQ